MSCWNITSDFGMFKVKVISPLCFGGVRYPFNIKLQKGSYPSCPIPIFLPRFFVCWNLSASPQSSPLVQLQAHVGWSSPQLLGPKKAWRERWDLSTDTKHLKPQNNLEMFEGQSSLFSFCWFNLIHSFFSPLVGIPKILYIIYSMYKQIYTHIITYTIKIK